MTRLKRTVRMLGICLALLVFLAAAGLFVASWVAGKLLEGDRSVNGVTVRFHNPRVSMLFAVRADSVVIEARAARAVLVRAEAGMDYWGGLTPALAVFGFRADSVAVSLREPDEPAADGAAAFPAWLRFPVGVRVEWRVLTLALPGGGGLAAGPVRFDTRGAQAVHVALRSVGAVGADAVTSPESPAAALDATVDAHWRGRWLRYKLVAHRAETDTLVVLGSREKRDMRWGHDTVRVFSAHPGDWRPMMEALRTRASHASGAGDPLDVPRARPASAALGDPLADSLARSATDVLSLVSAARLTARAQWRADGRRDSLKVAARFRTPASKPLEAAAWDFTARLGSGGGAFSLRAAGARQTLNAAGRWTQPGPWYSAPRWEMWRGEFSGAVRGGTWAIGRFGLPLDFDVPNARLDTGLRVAARVTTPAASRIDLRWSGRAPDRLELSGEVARGEPWAVAWTGDHVDYAAARVAGVWEKSVLTVTARMREPRAYGNAADSLVADNQVTSSGYFLRRGLIYRDGEVFTGDGEVLWRTAAGARAVSLRFDAGHPKHGHAGMTMRLPGPLALTADSLRPARFPYEPLRRLAGFDPWVDGRFLWDRVTGEGGTRLRARFIGNDTAIDADVEATWRRDSLRVRRFDLASGAARLKAEAVLPFDGRALKWPGGANSLMNGTWNIGADGLEVGEVLELARRSARLFRDEEGREGKAGRPTRPGAANDNGDGIAGTGTLNGELGFSPARGMAGLIRLQNLRLPAHTGLSDVTGVVVTGMGDSLRADAMLSPGAQARWNDTLFAVFSGLGTPSPRFHVASRSTGGFATQVEGMISGWNHLSGTVRAEGRIPLAEGAGSLENIRLQGRLSGAIDRDMLDDLDMSGGSLFFHHVSGLDTQKVQGVPSLTQGVVRLSRLTVSGARGETLRGRAEYDAARGEAALSLSGEEYRLTLPGGGRFEARDIATSWMWTSDDGLSGVTEAGSGFVALPASPHRMETGFENVVATLALPPARTGTASTLKVQGRLHDFYFQRRWGWRDATSFFTGIGRGGAGPRAPGGLGRGRPWDLDIRLTADGANNRIDTDVLRMNFAGDAHVTGTYPYLLVNGKISGLQGEVGQSRQAYALRDFEVRWDNVTLEDGTLYVEGEKRVRADCRPDTRQTCQIFIRLDGRLEDIGFTYETDCTQSSGDPVSPSVLINSMAQGCYVSETPGGEGNYGSAAFAMLEPALNDRLSRGVARGSGGFIKSTQVSGLSALIGSDSSGLESVALEVESRSVYRTSLKGRAGYHPETKLANPMEYRLAAEYRPPLERVTEDSVWRARLKDRVTVEAAVETRPEGRDIEEERRVRQRAGLRYRYRFWDLW